MVLDAPIGRHRLAAGVEFAVPLCRTSSVPQGKRRPGSMATTSGTPSGGTCLNLSRNQPRRTGSSAPKLSIGASQPSRPCAPLSPSTSTRVEIDTFKPEGSFFHRFLRSEIPGRGARDNRTRPGWLIFTEHRRLLGTGPRRDRKVGVWVAALPDGRILVTAAVNRRTPLGQRYPHYIQESFGTLPVQFLPRPDGQGHGSAAGELRARQRELQRQHHITAAG